MSQCRGNKGRFDQSITACDTFFFNMEEIKVLTFLCLFLYQAGCFNLALGDANLVVQSLF